MENIRVSELFDLKHTIASEYLKGFAYPWEALPGICDLVRTLGKGLDEAEYEKRGEDVWVHRSARVVPTAVLAGPVIVGPGSFVGHCAFVRNGVLLGSDCTVGTCVEVKNSIIFDKVDLAHFNYVGDSILGFGSHLGGGAITSNLRLDEKNITIRSSQAIDTGLMKVGAMVGDKVQVGCNAILNPGAILGRNSVIYPLVSVKGVVASNSVVKA
ncbi:MAG: hypothetical protein IJ663_00800 [Spirochaetales bacterium]|nr:hypothetical protein [Spirochaetales bacterium]